MDNAHISMQIRPPHTRRVCRFLAFELGGKKLTTDFFESCAEIYHDVATQLTATAAPQSAITSIGWCCLFMTSFRMNCVLASPLSA